MNKIFIIVGLIILIVGGTFLGIRFLSGEDNWICENGQWVKHGNPSASQPTTGCGEQGNNQNVKIFVTTPKPGDTIQSPLFFSGGARGSWYFEANFPVKVIDANGAELGILPVQAQGDWMTNNFVPFSGTINFSKPMTEDGFVVFQKDNPSGLPQNADEFRVPIKFDIAEKMKVKAYFINDKLDPQISCNKVFAVEREVAKTERVAKAALDELLKGPSQADLNAGYSTSINTGVIIQSVTAKDGILTVDFNDQLEYQAGGSCKTAAIRAQITQTLMQFSTVKSVIISINGRTEDILQP